MCADSFSAREAENPDRRLRESAGRRGVTRGGSLFESPAAPTELRRPVDYVGRVGALAVALGVGAAILGFTGVAAAETGGGDTAGAGGRESSAGDPGQKANNKGRSGNRRGARDGAAGSQPAPPPAVDVEIPETLSIADDTDSPSVRSGRGSTGARSVAVPNRIPVRDTDSATAPQSSTDAALLGALLNPGGVQNLLQESVTSLIGSLFSAAPPDAVSPDATTSEVVAVPQVAAVAVPEPPAMTAAAQPDTLASTDAGPLAALSVDGNGAAPLVAPLAWAALAAARRDDPAGATPEVAPAAVVGTAETVDPTVGAERAMTITSVTPGSGQVGTTITITGTAFNPSAIATKVGTVYFGCSNGSATCTSGQTATPISVSNTAITVKVPAGATTGYIQVFANTSPKVSWSSYSPQQFTVEASVPAPTIAGLSQGSGLVGDSVTIAGTNFTQAATVKFGCTSNNCPSSAKTSPSVTFVDSETITATVPTGAPSGYVQVATASGAGYSPSPFTVNKPAITSLDPATGTVGSALTINGSFFAGATGVTFAGGADGKGVTVPQSGFEVIDGTQAVSQILVAEIPVGAQTGKITVTTPSGSLTSPTAWTNAVQPTIAAIAPNKGNIGSEVTVTGTNFTNADGDSVVQSVKFTSLGAPQISGISVTTPTILIDAQFEVVSNTQIIATVPDKATTGPLVVTTSGGSATSGNAQYAVNLANGYPKAPEWLGPTGITSLQGPLGLFQGYIVTAISEAVTGVPAVAESAGPAGRCVTEGCPIPAGQSTPSVANTIGEYGYNIVYALMGAPKDLKVAGAQAEWDANVGNQVVSLASQPNVLTFISETVGGSTPFGAAAGNAVATFVQKSFGNPALATAFAPFLEALNLPTTLAAATPFLTKISSDGINAALLSTFKPAQAQKALVTFFTDPVVQGVLQDAATSAIKVLLGLESPDWQGAPQPPADAVASYLGQTAASALLGVGNDYSGALGDTIGDAIDGLFTNIGGLLAADAGDALVTLLNWAPPLLGEQNVPTILANNVVNIFVGALQSGCTDCQPLPFPDQPPLLPSLAPAAGDAVSGLVNSVLSAPAVATGLRQFVSQLVPGVLTNQGIQELIEYRVELEVTKFLGDDLGAVVGPQVGVAVAGLLADPAVSDALAAFVNTLVAPFLGNSAAGPVLADAAGQLAAAELAGDLSDVLPSVVEGLRSNAAIQAVVQSGVSGAVTALLDNKQVWQAVDTTLSTVVTELLADTPVQDAVYGRVYAEVYTLLGGTQLAESAAAQAGGAVVALMQNADVRTALVISVNTFVSDFIETAGVVDALAAAAGDLAAAEVSGNTAAIGEIIDQLRASSAIQDGVQTAVTNVIAPLLSNRAVVQALGQTLAVATTVLLEDAAVQQELRNRVATLVTDALAGSPIAEAAGAAAGAAVAQFLAVPSVGSELGAIIGAVVPDFLDAEGVPGALAEAAGELAAAAVAGTLSADLPDILKQLWADPAIKPAVKLTLADTLTLIDSTLLSDAAVAQALGAVTTTLIEQLATSAEVREYVTTQLGTVVGPAVAELLTNTAVVDDIATAVGSAVTQLLGYAGFDTALTDSIATFADAVLDGSTPAEALTTALQGLEANPAYQAAVAAVLPSTLNSLFKNAAVRKALATATKTIVIDQLKQSGINNGFIDGVAGQVVGGTVDSFLGTRAGEDLIDDVVLNVLAGMPFSDVTTYATQQVIRDPLLQVALGMSIGQGIGSLLGDNIVGHFVGLVAGVPITLVIGVGSGIALVYQWLFGGPSLAVNPAGVQSAESHFFQPLSAASDTYVISAIIPDLRGAEVSREAILANAQFTLTGMTLTEPDGAEPGSLDVMMTVAADESKDSGKVPEIRAAFRFRLDRLVSATAPSSLPADARRVRVS